jgi:GNAT superfamily N-acetyltransferase
MPEGEGFTVSRLTGSERLPDVLALVHASFAGFSPPSGALFETLDDFTERLRAGSIFIAQAGRAIIGSVFSVRKSDALYLTRMATLPAWRRRGVARALLIAAATEARNAGCTCLTLRVRINLPENRAFFERGGFVVTGQGQDPGRSPYYAMERRLT